MLIAASVFGEMWRLEPLCAEKKRMWTREMEWLLAVADHVVEFVPSSQSFPDGHGDLEVCFSASVTKSIYLHHHRHSFLYSYYIRFYFHFVFPHPSHLLYVNLSIAISILFIFTDVLFPPFISVSIAIFSFPSLVFFSVICLSSTMIILFSYITEVIVSLCLLPSGDHFPPFFRLHRHVHRHRLCSIRR